MMKTIYILTQGVVLRTVGRRLRLEKGKQRLFEVPLKDVGSILIYSHTEVTGPTITTLLEHGISLYYVRRSGVLKGKLSSATDKHVLLRRRQHLLFANDAVSIPLARSIIQTKLQNMKTVIQYILRKGQGSSALCQPIVDACAKLEQCQTRDEVMGVEGAAAAHYFNFYGSQLPAPFQFRIRSRQPARDPANALLNLGYMTLLREVEAHLESHHLDPYLGVLHATQDSRVSLALDILEEFRQPFIDIFVLKLLNLKQLTPEHFQSTSEGGIEMTQEGFHKFFMLYEKRMGLQDGESPGLRKLIDEQVLSLRRYIMGEGTYQHFQTEVEAEIVQGHNNM